MEPILWILKAIVLLVIVILSYPKEDITIKELKELEAKRVLFIVIFIVLVIVHVIIGKEGGYEVD